MGTEFVELHSPIVDCDALAPRIVAARSACPVVRDHAWWRLCGNEVHLWLFAVGQLFSDGKIDLGMKNRLKDAVISGRDIRVRCCYVFFLLNVCVVLL